MPLVQSSRAGFPFLLPPRDMQKIFRPVFRQADHIHSPDAKVLQDRQSHAKLTLAAVDHNQIGKVFLMPAARTTPYYIMP